MISIGSDLVKHHMEIFMDDFFMFRSYFDDCLTNLGKVLKSYKEKHLTLNREKVSLYGEKGDSLRLCYIY